MKKQAYEIKTIEGKQIMIPIEMEIITDEVVDEIIEIDYTVEELAEIKENTESIFNIIEDELWYNKTHKWDKYTVEMIKVLLDAEIIGYCPIALLDNNGNHGELEIDVDLLREMCGIKLG